MTTIIAHCTSNDKEKRQKTTTNKKIDAVEIFIEMKFYFIAFTRTHTRNKFHFIWFSCRWTKLFTENKWAKMRMKFKRFSFMCRCSDIVNIFPNGSDEQEEDDKVEETYDIFSWETQFEFNFLFCHIFFSSITSLLHKWIYRENAIWIEFSSSSLLLSLVCPFHLQKLTQNIRLFTNRMLFFSLFLSHIPSFCLAIEHSISKGTNNWKKKVNVKAKGWWKILFVILLSFRLLSSSSLRLFHFEIYFARVHAWTWTHMKSIIISGQSKEKNHSPFKQIESDAWRAIAKCKKRREYWNHIAMEMFEKKSAWNVIPASLRLLWRRFTSLRMCPRTSRSDERDSKSEKINNNMLKWCSVQSHKMNIHHDAVLRSQVMRSHSFLFRFKWCQWTRESFEIW